MLKKLTLLAMAVGALVAFAIPAAASAQKWYTDPGTILVGGVSEADTFTGTGTLSSTAGVTTGPATVHVHGFLWNGPTGKGVIEKFVITGPIAVQGLPPTCQATATNSTEGESGEEWPIESQGAEGKITISNVSFTNHYNAACQAFGLPATVTATGSVTGTLNGASEIEFNNAGHLKAGATNVAINGKVAIDGVGGTTYTLK